jgi:hypothetical protein
MTDSVSTSRLYGGSIAIVSGLYSLYLPASGPQMTVGGWFMLALGAIVLLHGIALLTPAAGRLGNASGPLMIGYSMLMLLNQARLVTGVSTAGGMDTGGMNGGMGGTDGMGSTMEMAAMGADAGMVAIAALMLASGVIMTVRRERGTME